MAGVFAASATPALAAKGVTASQAVPPALDFTTLMARSREQMLTMLASIRTAAGRDSRAHAFAKFKTAFAMHEYTETMASAGGGTAGAHASRALYRQEDPNKVLARVIVRELDAWPTTDAGWMRRFCDLENIVHQGVTTV